MMSTFISCDWGTSSFRLRLADVKTQAVIAEYSSNEGIAHTFEEWKKTENTDPDQRIAFYNAVLIQNIKALEKKISQLLDDVPIVISGMVSSTIGMIELPYHPVPFKTEGSQLTTQLFSATDAFRHEVLIISGVRSDDDVMRGEETQLMGLMDDVAVNSSGESLYIFPGTHSKHMQVKDGSLVNFKTYMTGEFFNLLTKHSILKDSVEIEDHTDFESFKRGVEASLQRDVLHTAFSVRTNLLFHKLNKQQNYFYLSGLLIGAELQELKHNPAATIFMCSGSNLSIYYTTALEVLGLSGQTTVFDPQLIDEAVVRGQLKIYNSLKHENL